LVAGGQWVGNISAFYQEPTTFPEAEIRRLTALSGQAAVVVQGLRQLGEIQARARREALIREITGKIRASTNLDTILQTTVTEVSRALGTSHGAIRLGTEESLEMRNSHRPSETSPPDLAPASSAEDVAESRQELHHPTDDVRGDGADEPGQKPQRKTAQEPTSPSSMDKGGQE
jgi:GAF domain-containing protein